MLGDVFRRRTVLAAVCDVDRKHAERFRRRDVLEVYSDYRRLLDRKDIEAVVVATPDHWHTAICLRALRSGKDIYCEKPLTLTIDEGKLIVKAVRETGRVVQVGTQRRTDPVFLKAVVLGRSGHFGTIRRIDVDVGTGPHGGPFRTRIPPAHLDWNFWLGQAPAVPYTRERCHGSFRWWYEYSGGKVTDWGSHLVDIAQWGIGMEASGPVSIESVRAELPDRDLANRFNTAKSFSVRCRFPNGVSMFIGLSAGPRISFSEFFSPPGGGSVEVLLERHSQQT